jgi:hypothetical protein
MGAAFTFRAGAGFPGEVTRQENSIIEPVVLNASNPPLLYGVPMVIDSTGGNAGIVRPLVAGDSGLTAFYGILVRPFPTSQASVTNFGNTPLGGAGVPPTSGPASLLVSGYIAVQVPVAQTLAVKNGLVFIWVAATSGAHIQGGFETVSSGSTISIPASLCRYNGAQDANGIIELAFNT